MHQMTSETRSISHYLSPTMLLAYLWAYTFTVFSVLVGLQTTRIWPSWLTWPAVVFGFGAVFALAIGLRTVLLDLTAGLDLRERFGIFLIQVALFFTPKLTIRNATLIDCLIVLQVSFAALLLRRENFLRLYAANFLLVALSVFVAWQKWGGGFEWAAGLILFLAGCFVADQFFLEIDRYPNIAARPVKRPLWLGIQYAVAALAGGSLLYLLTPDFPVVEPSAETAPTVVEHPAGVQTVSFQALTRLIWDTLILMVLVIAALALLQWLKRKYRRKQTDEEATIGGGVMRMVRKIIRLAPKPPQMPRGFSPREQILRGYWAWCDELGRFGLARSAEATPKEFAHLLSRNNPAIGSPVAALTQLFEWAKYDRRALCRGEAEAFFAHARQVIETLLAAAKM